MDTDSVTILKYRLGSAYNFHVMDKFVESDEAERLDRMMGFSNMMAELHSDYEELWIKTCPIFAIK